MLSRSKTQKIDFSAKIRKVRRSKWTHKAISQVNEYLGIPCFGLQSFLDSTKVSLVVRCSPVAHPYPLRKRRYHPGPHWLMCALVSGGILFPGIRFAIMNPWSEYGGSLFSTSLFSAMPPSAILDWFGSMGELFFHPFIRPTLFSYYFRRDTTGRTGY